MTDITPAQLAFELNVSAKYIRSLLRDEFGVLPPEEGRWLLDEARAQSVRDRFSVSPAPHVWHLEPGDELRRRAIHSAVKGQQQGGISTPTSTPDVLIFTDPDSGRKFGYDKFEGLREDGNYSYTGEGQVGDQRIDAGGNKALAEARQNGKTIRLFLAKSPYATYVGAFTLGTPAYWEREIPDANGNLRRGYVFNLEPIDAETDLLPPYGGEVIDEPLIRKWTPPEFSDVVVEPGETPAQPEQRVVTRVEFELQRDFGVWMEDQADVVKDLTLPVEGTAIHPDLYIESRGFIVEAKRSNARKHVREALGQVLDYVHVARGVGIDATPVVLLPSAPADDLVKLLHFVGIVLAYREPDGPDFALSFPSAES